MPSDQQKAYVSSSCELNWVFEICVCNVPCVHFQLTVSVLFWFGFIFVVVVVVVVFCFVLFLLLFFLP